MDDINFGSVTEQTINLSQTGNQIYETSTSSIFIQFFALLVILFVVFFLLVFIKRRSENIFNKSNNISEIERFYFYPKSFISIVKIGEEYFIATVNENDIRITERIEDKNLIEKLKLENAKKEKNNKDFSSFMNFGNTNFDSIKNRLKNMRQNENEK
ncbi:MAG: hypothetical protein GX287_05010 [Fusobacteria bacterium]|nr:hypothetical protein [Fusobacteriota bacterium]